MIDTTALKTSIIDLAVSGKISSSFQAGDSVSEILDALPEVSGKRKRLLGQAFEYGDRHETPSHWKWIRLGEIASYGDTPTKAFFDDVSGDTWILDLEDIKAGGTLLVKTRVQGKKFVGDKTVFKAGQILYSKLRPYLKKVLVADEDGVSTPELISFDTFGGILPQYIVYCLWSSFTDRAIDKRSYGIKMPRVDTGFMVNLPIPLPPVSEQHFIVERVQSAFSALDTIDALQAKYADNLTVLKSKLIDAAIQGKLTEQLPEDGTADELYRQIQAEKQALIKSGKIKKEKPLPEITADEIPFEIPEEWKWVRLSDLCKSVMDGDHQPPPQVEEGLPFLVISNISKGFFDLTNVRHVPRDYYGSLTYERTAEQGDILFTVTGSFGIPAIVDIDGEFCFQRHIALLKPLLWNSYLFYALRSGHVQKFCDNVAIGTAQRTVGIKQLRKILIPLPPLAEQKRVVRKLEELLPMCEKVEDRF